MKTFFVIIVFVAYLFLKLLFWYENKIGRIKDFKMLKKYRYRVSWYKNNREKYHAESSTI